MLDLYIKTNYFPAYPVKSWKIIRTDDADFIQIDDCKTLLPLNKDTMLFQEEVCDFTLDDRIPFVVYDHGDLKYMYSLRKDDDIIEDFQKYKNSNDMNFIFPFALKTLEK